MLDASSALEASASYFGRHVPTLGLGIGRVLLGCVLLHETAAKLRARTLWLSADGFGRPCWPSRERDLLALLALQAVATVAFTIGFATPLAGLMCAATLLLLHRKNPSVLNGGDAFAQLLVVLLALSPAGSSLSIDRLLRDGTLGLTSTASPGAARVLWLEVACLYLVNVVAKLRDRSWRDGSAVGICLSNPSFARFDPRFTGAWPRVASCATWATLAAELLLGPGLLLDEPRRGLWLLVGFGLHLGIWLSLRVHLFGPVMIAALATFIEPSLLGLGGPTHEPLAVDRSQGILAAAYVALVLVSNLPWPLKQLRRAQVRTTQLRLQLGLHRGWTMFSSPPREVLELEVVVVTPSGAWRGPWNPLAPLSAPAPLAGYRMPDHRVERMKFALLRDTALQAQLSERLGEALRARPDLVAVGVASTQEPVGAPAGADLLPGRVLFMATRARTAELAERAMLSIAATSRSRALVQAALLRMFDIAARDRAGSHELCASRSAAVAVIDPEREIPAVEGDFAGDRSVRARWVDEVTMARSSKLVPKHDPARNATA